MKAVTVCFENPDVVIDYYRLLKVFAYSWNKHDPDIPLEQHIIKPPDKTKTKFGFDANTRKLDIWAERFDQDTIFVDCDMLCTRPVADGFDLISDVGYTVREGADFILNGGVSFFKYTEKGRAFMDEYVRINRAFFDDPEFWGPWRTKYDGLNQAAFGYVTENRHQADPLPEIYNLCYPWDDWQQAKMIHIKSRLRRQCLTGKSVEPYNKPIVALWRGIEKELKPSGPAFIRKKATKKMTDEIAVIMRGVGERTTKTCMASLGEELHHDNVVLLEHMNLSQATRALCHVARDIGKKWTLMIGADYIPRPGFLRDLYDIADKEDDLCMMIKGIIRDKFVMEIRGSSGGPMLYRTDLLSQWPDILDDVDNGLTTEAQCNNYFYNRGYYAHRSHLLLALHDYEQHFHDIYRNQYVYGRKLKGVRRLDDRWKNLAKIDDDFEVARYAYKKGMLHKGKMIADFRYDYGFNASPFAQWKKDPLTEIDVSQYVFQPFENQIK